MTIAILFWTGLITAFLITSMVIGSVVSHKESHSQKAVIRQHLIKKAA